MNRTEFLTKVNEYMEIGLISDYGPNGLQVEGRDEINSVIAGVTASRALIEKAIERKADAILVHHGILWRGQNERITGSHKERLKLLLQHEINLIAYHLPLDRHPEVGNNALLAKYLQLQHVSPFGTHKGQHIGIKGKLNQAMPADAVVTQLQQILKREPIWFNFGPSKIRKIGIVSGGAQEFLQEAAEEKLDMFITGEVSEYNYHLAQEEFIHFVSAGHHATERFGIIALGNWIEQHLGVPVEYVEIDNPV